MLYIHQSSCISHQPTFNEVSLDPLLPSENNLLFAIEPKYTGIPLGQLRRMGRALRMGVGAAMKLLSSHSVDGILIGTANGGIEDSILFLNQIHEYREGRLTPTNFVQSTYNAIAGMLGMITGNKNYNATHVHRGQAFENTMLDTAMLLMENSDGNYLIGGVDEISEKNHRLVTLAGWYRTEPVLNNALFDEEKAGTIAGEGAAMFIVSGKKEGASSHVSHLKMINGNDINAFTSEAKTFIGSLIQDGGVDILLSGENGDSRLTPYYLTVEKLIQPETSVLRFKHMFGEFQTVSALALWLSDHVLQTQIVPEHLIKRRTLKKSITRILIYNNYQGFQHSFILVELPA